MLDVCCSDVSLYRIFTLNLCLSTNNNKRFHVGNFMPTKYNQFVEKGFPYSIPAFVCGVK